LAVVQQHTVSWPDRAEHLRQRAGDVRGLVPSSGLAGGGCPGQQQVIADPQLQRLHSGRQSPEMKVKRDEGPVGFMTILPTGMGNMVTMQAKNVLYHAVVSLFVAYIAVVTLAPGTEYLKVFQVTGTAAFLAYGFAWGHQVIWFGRPFKVAMKELCDGLVMALVTAGIFGWRWPGM
ncbi:MAG: hypothetical protein ABJB33_02350, partial [Gemmatimonadota bacterium]